MNTPDPGGPKKRGRLARVVATVAILGSTVIGACEGDRHLPALSDLPGAGGSDAGSHLPTHPGIEGASCSPDGSTAACGRVEYTNGDYVTCSIGHTTCINGKWSTCVGDHIVTRSLPNIELTMHGVHVLSTPLPTACENICDPYCFMLQPTPTDVDAAGIQGADGGGLTLSSDASVGAPPTSACSGLQCEISSCPNMGSTTLSGTVYDPAGKNPLYNAFVYIPLNPAQPLPPFSQGASCDTCGGASSLEAIQATQTDAFGNFTLTNVPSGTNVPIVVQMGKWRREVVISNVASCANNSITNNCTAPNQADCVFRLPKNHADGYDPVAGTYSKADMPEMAIITGSADPFDCLLLKAGIDPNEVGDYTSTSRIHYYESDDSPGNKLDPAYGSNVNGSVLWNNLNSGTPNLMSYDIVLLPCEGGAIDKQHGGNAPYQNLISYADAGGRSFITHFGYVWLEYPAGKSYVAAPDNWGSVANWSPTGTKMTGSIDTQDPLTGTVNTGFPKGGVYSQWLQNVGATTTASKLAIHEGRQDLTTIGASAQGWMTARDTVYSPAPNYTNLLTFNTPYGAAPQNQCGRVVFSDFHVSANALVGSSNKCITNNDCGFSATCVGATQGAIGQCSEPCSSSSDCPSTSFTCAGAVTGTCQETACTTSSQCGTGRLCQNGTCTCGGASDCDGGACVGMTCSVISCTSSAGCGLGTCAGGTCNSVTCHSNADCGLGSCGGTGKTGTCNGGTACHKNSDCGISATCGSGSGATAGTCSTSAQACKKNADCDSNSCGAGSGSATGTCANGGGHTCHKNGDCDGGSCGSGTNSATGLCGNPGGHVCHGNGDCDSGSCGSGTGSTGGTCPTSGGACTTNADCDSNSCGAGTGSTAGTCSTNGQACRSNAQCDSGSCGSGTGSATGVCSYVAGRPCTANTDCDSNSCGSGTGAVAGLCGTNGQACRNNGQCDSNSCGSGTGAVAGSCGTNGQPCQVAGDCDSSSCGSGTGATAGACFTNGQPCHQAGDCDSGVCGASGGTAGVCGLGTSTPCHKAGDCDSGVCGSGASGSIKGSCSTSGQPCHKTTDCDSGVCGTGASGSTKGTCSAGTCASSANCKNGATCTAGKCVGGCTIDTDCGTGGMCSGATCSTKTCSADSSCTVGTKTCVGATCTAKACTADSNCSVSPQCNGATCSAKSCAGNTSCGASNRCLGATCSTATCAGDASCKVSSTCSGATCSTATCAGSVACGVSKSCTGATCSSPAACAGDVGCPSSHTCTGAKCSNASCAGNAGCPVGGACSGAKCSTQTCGADATCPVGKTCTGAKCSNVAACTSDAACPSSNSCTGAKCGNSAACAGDVGCPSSSNCTGAKCSTLSCAGDVSCTVGQCNNAKCSKSVCNGDSDCLTGTCSGAKCTPPASCGSAADCGKSATCSGAKCNASSCASSSDCGSGSTCGGQCAAFTCTKNSDCSSGICNNGTCACTTGENCGGAQSCVGATQGLCQKSCTTDTDCAPDRCIAGKCGGCSSSSDCHDNAFTASCGGIPSANYGKCSVYNQGQFPEACKQGTLSAQEKALEFMFFDLTACVSPDNLPPPPPTSAHVFPPATFTENFTASCMAGTSPAWREVDWQATIPSGASIVFSAQSGSDTSSLVPGMPLLVATATKTTDTGPSETNYDLAFIDTGTDGTGAFNTTNPAVLSKDVLRLTITLKPTPDELHPPVLRQWRVQYDCLPSQ